MSEFEPPRDWQPEKVPEMVTPEPEVLFKLEGTSEGDAFVRYFRKLYGDSEIMGVIRREEKAELIAMVEQAISNINAQFKNDAETKEFVIKGERHKLADLIRQTMLREGEDDTDLFDVFPTGKAPMVAEKFGETLSPIADKFEPGYDSDEAPEQKITELHHRMLTVARKVDRILRGHGGR